MDATVRKRGDVSRNASRKGFRVDYQDFFVQVKEFTQHPLLLDFAGHGDVLHKALSILEEVKLGSVFPEPPALFKHGYMEEALMRLTCGGQVVLEEEAEAEGTPRLMPREKNPYVFGSELKSGGRLPSHKDASLQTKLSIELQENAVSWVFGKTGVGKSRRTPLAALMATTRGKKRWG